MKVDYILVIVGDPFWILDKQLSSYAIQLSDIIILMILNYILLNLKTMTTLQFTNGPNTLECYIKLGFKDFLVTNSIAYWEHL